MDEMDKKIISILKKNSRTSFVEIAYKLGFTEGAIRSRINKLVKDKIIKKFTIGTEEEMKAIIMVTTSTSIPTTEIANRIRKLGVDNVYEISGDYDIICFIRSEAVFDIDNLVEKLRGTKGVIKTKTYTVLK